MFRVHVAEPPEVRVTVLLLRDILRPEGAIDVERLTLPTESVHARKGLSSMSSRRMVKR